MLRGEEEEEGKEEEEEEEEKGKEEEEEEEEEEEGEEEEEEEERRRRGREGSGDKHYKWTVTPAKREKANTLLLEPSAHLAVGGILDVRVHPSIPNSYPLQILSVQ